MAIPAINSVVAHRVLVAELHRRRPHPVLPRKMRRTRKPHHAGQCQSRQEYPREETKPGYKIRAAVKNLGHVYNCWSGFVIQTLNPRCGGSPRRERDQENPPSVTESARTRIQTAGASFQQIFSNCNCTTHLQCASNFFAVYVRFVNSETAMGSV